MNELRDDDDAVTHADPPLTALLKYLVADNKLAAVKIYRDISTLDLRDSVREVEAAASWLQKLLLKGSIKRDGD